MSHSSLHSNSNDVTEGDNAYDVQKELDEILSKSDLVGGTHLNLPTQFTTTTNTATTTTTITASTATTTTTATTTVTVDTTNMTATDTSTSLTNNTESSPSINSKSDNLDLPSNSPMSDSVSYCQCTQRLASEAVRVAVYSRMYRIAGKFGGSKVW